ncbi:MAG: DUF362 domain-containing protein [Myxococcales bacterium]|nr:DUF362 domain-containing protein [Myxococcales bacterium]
MKRFHRRHFLQLAASAAALQACQDPKGSPGVGGGGGGPEGAGGGGGVGGGSGAAGGSGGQGPTGGFPVAVTSYELPQDREAAIVAAVELSGGMPWLSPGDTVLIKVAMNSPNPYPATTSPHAVAALVKLCLDAGASRVFVADLMGLENTLVPGGWALEDPLGSGFDPDHDGTIRAFHASGLYAAVAAAAGESNIGPNQRVHLTSFREHGWYRFESESATSGTPYLVADWVRDQVETAETWDGSKPITKSYIKRPFDAGPDMPGMFVPNLVGDVDHIINCHRVSTHVMSHYTLSLKNWFGIMRPDDRIWMHQISYLKNHRGTGDDPIRSEPPYNLMLPELHASTWSRERLVVADASEVIASGGPDESDKDLFPARLAVAAQDLVSADVIGLSIIRQAVMASELMGGLGGQCAPPPQSAKSLSLGFLGGLVIPWKDAMYGNDDKLCDPSFSPWDWIAVQRARELGFGCPHPDELDLRFPTSGIHQLPAAQQSFLSQDAMLPPQS